MSPQLRSKPNDVILFVNINKILYKLEQKLISQNCLMK